jgi:YGGT family.
MLFGIFQGISYFLQLFRYAVLAYMLLTWILPPYHKVMTFFSRILDPVLGRVRQHMFRIFPRLPMDFSGLIVYFLIGVANSLLWQLYYLLR